MIHGRSLFHSESLSRRPRRPALPASSLPRGRARGGSLAAALPPGPAVPASPAHGNFLYCGARSRVAGWPPDAREPCGRLRGSRSAEGSQEFGAGHVRKRLGTCGEWARVGAQVSRGRERGHPWLGRKTIPFSGASGAGRAHSPYSGELRVHLSAAPGQTAGVCSPGPQTARLRGERRETRAVDGGTHWRK